MPDNLRIASFVLGSVLLLIAVLGGNFKLFGAEIASTVSSRFLRFAAFVLGVAFLIAPFYPYRPTSGPNSNIPSNPPSNPNLNSHLNNNNPSPKDDPIVSDLKIAFHTNDDDKDNNTGVSVTIQNVAEWHQVQDEVFPDQSEVVKALIPNSVALSNLRGHVLEVCISPVGNDTWRFNLTLTGKRSDGQRYFFSANSIELT